LGTRVYRWGPTILYKKIWILIRLEVLVVINLKNSWADKKIRQLTNKKFAVLGFD
jgi:hypothetical protein